MARYQGIPPQSATAIVLPEIVALHAGDAAFLWSIRRAAVKSQKYRVRDLAKADERVEAHLEGLEVAGASGWANVITTLEDGDPGGFFAGSVWAMRAGDQGRFGAALDVAGENRDCLDAMASAFGWAFSGGTARDIPGLGEMLVGSPSAGGERPPRGPLAGALRDTWARRLLTDERPGARYVGTAAFSVCGVPPADNELDGLLRRESEPMVVARAARLVGELGLVHAAGMLESLLVHTAAEVRRAVAWSLCVFQSNHQIATRVLMEAAEDEVPDRDAVELAARRLGGSHTSGWIRDLIKRGHSRAALLAVAAGGWPATIDDALALLSQKEHARLAGFALSQITGVDLVKLGLERETKKEAPKPSSPDAGPRPDPDPDEERPPLEATPAEEIPEEELPEEDGHLPDPDPEKVALWWQEHRDEFNPAGRYLAGRPIRQQGLEQTLLDGVQPQRRAAAVELACQVRGTPIFNTSQPGFVQARRFLGWT